MKTRPKKDHFGDHIGITDASTGLRPAFREYDHPYRMEPSARLLFYETRRKYFEQILAILKEINSIDSFEALREYLQGANCNLVDEKSQAKAVTAIITHKGPGGQSNKILEQERTRELIDFLTGGQFADIADFLQGQPVEETVPTSRKEKVYVCRLQFDYGFRQGVSVQEPGANLFIDCTQRKKVVAKLLSYLQSKLSGFIYDEVRYRIEGLKAEHDNSDVVAELKIPISGGLQTTILWPEDNQCTRGILQEFAQWLHGHLFSPAASKRIAETGTSLWRYLYKSGERRRLKLKKSGEFTEMSIVVHAKPSSEKQFMFTVEWLIPRGQNDLQTLLECLQPFVREYVLSAE